MRITLFGKLMLLAICGPLLYFGLAPGVGPRDVVPGETLANRQHFCCIPDSVPKGPKGHS